MSSNAAIPMAREKTERRNMLPYTTGHFWLGINSILFNPLRDLVEIGENFNYFFPISVFHKDCLGMNLFTGSRDFRTVPLNCIAVE